MTEQGYLFTDTAEEAAAKQLRRNLDARRHQREEVHTAPPGKRGTDRERLLEVLQLSGAEGVSSARLNEMFPQGTYTKRMSELRQRGYVIECRKEGRWNVFTLKGQTYDP